MARSSTSYSSLWLSGPTKVIRVPEVLAEAVLSYARKLDRGDGSADVLQTPQGYQSVSTSALDLNKPVNVAQVAQRSPFRYPGGKTWLVPTIAAWLTSFSSAPSYFLEPFAGGAICALNVAFERWSRHVVFCELDGDVAAVWKVILMGQAETLANKIRDFNLTEKRVRTALSSKTNLSSLPLVDQAFLTILRNRVQRGGIMAPGAGLVKRGENEKGLSSRWYPETLATRILNIERIADRLTFRQGDGMDLIEEFANEPDAALFADPPYTTAARRLYRYWQFDHEELFRKLSSFKGDFLISYDDTEEVRKWSKKHGFGVKAVAMKNTHHSVMTELLIGRDLSWMDRSISPTKPGTQLALENV